MINRYGYYVAWLGSVLEILIWYNKQPQQNEVANQNEARNRENASNRNINYM